MRFLVFGVVLLTMIFFSAFAGKADVLTIYTEEFPPYNYTNDAGDIVGISTESVRKVMQEAQLSYNIMLLPWPRAVREAAETDNSLLYSLGRSVEREEEYDWLVYLTHPQFYLFSRLMEKRNVTLAGIRKGVFSAICEETDVSCSILSQFGFPDERLLKIQEGSLSELNMVRYGRADLYLEDLNSYPYRMKALGIKELVTKPVLKVGDGLAFYLTATKKVKQSTRDKIRNAYGRLVERGELPPAPR